MECRFFVLIRCAINSVVMGLAIFETDFGWIVIFDGI